ncbi:MAG: PIG-L deacetylase family protein [Mycobacteriales bacterium]
MAFSDLTRRPLARLVARGKPLVPEALWPLLLTLRSAAGDGPLVGVPAFRRVLALAAHPDDESIGCAGTLALLAGTGAQVTVVFATDGEATIGAATDPAQTGRLRVAEAREACRLLGVSDARFLGRPDRGLPAVARELGAELAGILAETRPEVLLLPWFLDGHPDHQALSTALAYAGPRPDLQVWGYETWTPLPANRLVDVTAVIERKQAALAAHVTASLAFDVGAASGLSRWRSVHGLMGRGYAEAFLAAPAADYLALAAAVESGVRG